MSKLEVGDKVWVAGHSNKECEEIYPEKAQGKIRSVDQISFLGHPGNTLPYYVTIESGEYEGIALWCQAAHVSPR